METRTIWWDMDGTCAALYSVVNWLDKLINEDPSPYEEAAPIGDLLTLAEISQKLQKKGFRIGIISWTSKNGSTEYNKAVRKVKREWLKKNFPIEFDEIHIVKYGTPKYKFSKYGDILIDDEEKNRKDWKKGIAVNPVEISIQEFLENLL